MTWGKRKVTDKRWLRAGAVVLAMLATACSGDASDSTTDSSGTGAPSDERDGGTLTVGSDNEPDSLDPIAMSGGQDEIAADLLYDSIVRRRKYGDVPEPNAAESLVPSDDLKTWTIKIRPGITFSDGTPLDAAALKANIDRNSAPDSVSVVKSTLSLVASTDVVDDLTVQVNLSGPWANLPYALTFPLASPTAVEKEGDKFSQNPVGSGPYTLKEWVPGDHLTFERRDDYWGKAAGRDCCHLDTVIIRTITSESTRNTALANGEIDIALVASPDTIKAAQDGDGSIIAGVAPAGAAPGWLVPFNLNDPVVSDIRVRTAMAYSIDREALLNLDSGLTSVNLGPFAGTAWDNGTQYPGLDLEKATAAADEYTAEKGPIKIALRIYNDPSAVKLSQALQTMWKAVGIETEIVNTDYNATIGAVLSGEYQALLIKSGFISPHPDFILPIFMASKGGLLFTNKADPDIDAALDAARVTTDVDEQKVAYKVIDDKFASDLIWLWTNTGVQGITYRSCIKGSAVDGAALTNTGVPDLSTQIWTTC